MNPLRRRLQSPDAHPVIDGLERLGGLPLVFAAGVLVAGVATMFRIFVPA